MIPLYTINAFLLLLYFRSSFAVKCGQNTDTDSGFRILGGKDAGQGKVPWQTSLTIGSSHVCGGSIIAPSWVLTAAHCFDKYANNTHVNTRYKYYAVAGALIRRKGYKVGQRCQIEKFIFHPKYNKKNLFADIMLLKLKTPFQYRQSPRDNKNATAIGPICLPDIKSKEWNYKGETKISGFGLTKHKGNASETLRFIYEKVLDDKLCEQKFPKGKSKYPYDRKTMVCAGSLKKDVSTCQGDSGGPLVARVGDHYIQKGIVSYGAKCGSTTPTVYTRVLPYRSWIKEKSGV